MLRRFRAQIVVLATGRAGRRSDRLALLGGLLFGVTAFLSYGLILLAYPLHPAGKPEKLRDAHLPRITAPVLCFNGTRDTLCRRDLMEKALEPVTTAWQMHWIEGADHSLTGQSVMDDMADAAQRWVARLN